MSQPPAGLYYIINTVPSTTNQAKLAISYDGVSGNALYVNTLDTTDQTQVWNITNYDSTSQSISPLTDPTVEVAFGQGFLTTLEGNGYTWIITEGADDDNVHTFQDGGKTVFWYLEETRPIPDDNVTYTGEPNSQTQYWWLYNYS